LLPALPGSGALLAVQTGDLVALTSRVLPSLRDVMTPASPALAISNWHGSYLERQRPVAANCRALGSVPQVS
jgi:hypothetical protein